MNYRMSDIAAGWGLGILTCVAFGLFVALSSPKVEAQESRAEILQRAGAFKGGGRTGGVTPSGAYGYITVDTPRDKVGIFSDYAAGVKCYDKNPKYNSDSFSCVKVN